MVGKFERLKVFLNKANNQAYVVLPKKKLSSIPEFVFIKKGVFFKIK